MGNRAIRGHAVGPVEAGTESDEAMIGQCLSAMCMLGVVILGMLVMTRTVTLEEISNFAGRIFGIAVVATMTWCLLEVFVTLVVVPWLSSLKSFLRDIGILIVAFVVLTLIARAALSKYQH